MKFQYRNLFKNQKGQAAVELALVLPILLLILCGIIEVGWLFNNQLMISNLSREGARTGIIYSTNQLQTVQNKIRTMIPNTEKYTVVVSYPNTNHAVDIIVNFNYQARSEYTVEISYSNFAAPRTGDVIVNIVYHARPITPLTGIFVHGDIDLSSKCVMKLE